jgi:quinol-cytochrome oxidoreductase complex cytochrome b subunit
VLLTLSVLWPWEIGAPADPLQTPEGIKPEWYFLPTYQLLKYFSGPLGKFLGILVSGVPFLLLLLWPFLERSNARSPKKRRWPVRVGIVAVVLAVFFGFVGHISETTVRVAGLRIHFDMYGVPHVVESRQAPESAGEASADSENPNSDAPRETAAK